MKHFQQDCLPWEMFFDAFFYKRFVKSKQNKLSHIEVAKQLVAHWQDLKNSTVEQKDVVRRLKKIEETYDLLKNGKKRRTAQQLNQEENFECFLNKVFDIAPKVNYHHTKQHTSVPTNYLPVMETEIENLNSHLAKQQNSVPINDLSESNVMQSMEMDNQRMVVRRRKLLHSVADENIDMEVDDEGIDMKVDDEKDIDFEATLSKYHKSQFSIDEPVEDKDDIIAKIINSPDVCSALDRTNTATGSFVIILASIARALDVDFTTTFRTSRVYR